MVAESVGGNGVLVRWLRKELVWWMYEMVACIAWMVEERVGLVDV